MLEKDNNKKLIEQSCNNGVDEYFALDFKKFYNEQKLFFKNAWIGEAKPRNVLLIGILGNIIFKILPFIFLVIGIPFAIWQTVSLWRCSSPLNSAFWYAYRAYIVVSSILVIASVVLFLIDT